MKLAYKPIIIYLMLCCTVMSCVNLKHVNNFSSTSLQSISAFEAINYSFEQSCFDKCISENVNSLNIDAEACECAMEKTADSITLKMYGSVVGYFDGLSKLSDNEVTTYKTQDLEAALSEGQFGSITIGAQQVASYSKVSNVLIRAFTDGYRKKAIKQYVKDANNSIQELISFLGFNISKNLDGKLQVKKERIKADYFDLIQDESLSTVEKRNSISKYYTTLIEIEAQREKLKIYSKILQNASEGHQKLYDNIDHLKIDAIKQSLSQYASEIKSIISEFKKIDD